MTRNEFEIIEQFFNHQTLARQDVILGIGDDAAIVTIPNSQELAITTDTFISGVHFPSHTSAYDIGYKALAVNLSDLAAMGATPAWITLALTLPNADEIWLKAFSQGLFALANQYQVQLIGGDMTRGHLSITIQAHGFIPTGLALRRDNAKIGDLIYVSNTLGDAGLALQQPNANPFLSEKLNRPQPQILLGERLRGIANSAIDISDGLVADLGHILQKSAIGAIVNVDALPLSSMLKESVSYEEAIKLALTAGDDYELCFTVPETKTALLTETLKDFSYACIGKIVATTGLNLQYDNGEKYVCETSGYQHF